jgi:hypothetical protein
MCAARFGYKLTLCPLATTLTAGAHRRPHAVDGYELLDGLLDGIFIFDVLFVKLHTMYPYMGELMRDRQSVMNHYLRGWFRIDIVSALPIDAIVLSIARAAHVSSSTIENLQVRPGLTLASRTPSEHRPVCACAQRGLPLTFSV